MHAILSINRTKKSFHVIVYKLARIWSIRTRTHPTLLLWTTRSTTINYETENAVLSLCSMNITTNYWVTLKCIVRYLTTLTGACDFLALGHFSAFWTYFTSTVEDIESTPQKGGKLYRKTFISTTRTTDSTSEGQISPIFSHSYLQLLRPPQATMGS